VYYQVVISAHDLWDRYLGVIQLQRPIAGAKLTFAAVFELLMMEEAVVSFLGGEKQMAALSGLRPSSTLRVVSPSSKAAFSLYWTAQNGLLYLMRDSREN